MITNKECLLCRKLKSEFHVEHIFPKTIGGVFTTLKICAQCNTILGKQVDTPFLSFTPVAQFRKIYKLNRNKNRTIEDPLKKLIIINKEEQFTVRFNEIGQVEKRLIPTITPVQSTDYGNGFEITLSKADEKELLPKIIEREAKRRNLSVNQLTVRERKEKANLEEKIIVSAPNKLMVFEFIKILHEFALISIPDYYKDPIAIQLSDLLLHEIVPETLKEFINPNITVCNALRANLFSKFENLNKDEHVAFLTGIQGLGLIGFVKIFNYSNVMILTTSEKFETTPYFHYRNDFVKKGARRYIFRKFHDVTISLHFDDNLISSNNDISLEDFVCNEALIPQVFNDQGDLIYSDLFQIPEHLPPDNCNGNYAETLDCIYSESLTGIFLKTNTGIKMNVDKLVYHALIEESDKTNC